MQINRQALLQTLETVTPGLARRDVVEQSSCFVFRDGEVTTFNDEVCCRHSTELKFEGAVVSSSLLALLRKMTEETITVEVSDEELLISGKNRQAGIALEKEVLLPIDKIDKPTKWRKLPPVYSEAVNVVELCASKDEARFMLMCVHIHPEWMEACDNHQLCRYVFKTGVKKSSFIKRESIKHMADLGMTHFAESASWMHYKNPSGMILSCRRVADQDYPDLGPILETKGTKTTLPKGLSEAASKASVFSSENQDDDVVLVELRKGKLRITGRGVTGWYRETKRLRYAGQPMSFLIAPDLLETLVESYNDCEVNTNYLRVDGGSFTYVTCLGQQSEENGQA